MNQKDKKAKDCGWMILSPGEAYERVLSKSSSVFILKEKKYWIVWRGYWFYKNNPKPTKEKTIISKATFDTALTRANGYVNYVRNK